MNRATTNEQARTGPEGGRDVDGVRRLGRAIVVGLVVAVPVLTLGGWQVYGNYAAAEATRDAYRAMLLSHERLIAGPPGELLPVDRLVHGRDIFQATCAVCHKADGTGVDGLGKDLSRSWFVASQSDAALTGFIVRGRGPADPLNTTRIAMPPRGGREDLTDADLGDVVAYVRGLQDPRRMPPLPAPVAVVVGPATEDELAKALAAADGDPELAEYIAHGTKVFATTCSACHGKNGKGLPNLGKDLVNSAFCRTLDDDAFLAFLKRGRDPNDPLNTTKVGMPPKGGNPALSDDDLLDVIAYLRSLQKGVAAK